MNRLSEGRFDRSFEGRFVDEFNKFDLCNRCWSLVRGKVDEGFIWRYVNGILDINSYRWVREKVLLDELRLYWLEEKRNGV